MIAIYIKIKDGMAPAGFEAGKKYWVLMVDTSKDRLLLADDDSGEIGFVALENCLLVGYNYFNEPLVLVQFRKTPPAGFELGKAYLVLLIDSEKERLLLADSESKAMALVGIKDCMKKK